MNRARACATALCLLLVVAAFPGGAGADEKPAQPPPARKGDFPGIRKLMTTDEFASAGLDQLTPEQIRALDDWLIRYTAGEAKVVQSTSQEVREAAPELRIEARIVPPFTGWTGQTVFRLDNGQVWRQRMKGRYLYDGDDTRVVISKNFLGYYMLTLVATERSIGVEPVRTEGSGSKSP